MLNSISVAGLGCKVCRFLLSCPARQGAGAVDGLERSNLLLPLKTLQDNRQHGLVVAAGKIFHEILLSELIVATASWKSLKLLQPGMATANLFAFYNMQWIINKPLNEL
ncbi:MAG: hypothetical protein PHH58_11570 [Rhodoferax sp.]|nr:hypothetical protein [Rhodoferax sp.]